MTMDYYAGTGAEMGQGAIDAAEEARLAAALGTLPGLLAQARPLYPFDAADAMQGVSTGGGRDSTQQNVRP